MTDQLRKAAEQAREALREYASYGCPACTSDCSSANPPVYRCPTRMYFDAIAALDAALAAEGERKPSDKIKAGLEDALAFAKGDTSRARIVYPPAPATPKGGDANVSGRNADPETPKHDISPGSKCEPAGAITSSDAELVERLEAATCNIPWVQAMFSDAAAAIERLTRLCAAYEGTIKADERELDNDDETIERLRQALAAEQEARLAAVAMRNTAIEQRDLAAIKLKPSEDAAQEAIARAEAAEARVRELEAKASSPGP